jgi:hypothetical protein
VNATAKLKLSPTLESRCQAMRSSALIAGIAAVTLVLVGCKSKEQARVYAEDLDTTWAAAVRVVQDLTGADPEQADRENGRLVTQWVTLSTGTTAGAAGVTESEELARGHITLAADDSGTRVAIRVERRSTRAEDAAERNVGSGTVGVTLQPSRDGLAELFLDRLTEELETPTPSAEQPSK